MNIVVLCGRLTRDPELRYSVNSNEPFIRFTVAVDRRTKDNETDFIECKAFGKAAEIIGTYGFKGGLLSIMGSIRTGSYEKDGRKVYSTDVYVQNVELIDRRKTDDTAQTVQNAQRCENAPDGYNQLSTADRAAEAKQEAPAEIDQTDLPF